MPAKANAKAVYIWGNKMNEYVQVFDYVCPSSTQQVKIEKERKREEREQKKK